MIGVGFDTPPSPQDLSYERAERELSMHEAKVGLVVHAIVTAVVWAALIPINVVVAPEFPWSIFVVLGMGIGVFFHWFGYRHAEADTRRRQQQIESRAQNHGWVASGTETFSPVTAQSLRGADHCDRSGL